ncbi:hypothetical protein O7626_16010 [Micromonospora sp. WMMD1102]|uniref:hypothetical protein n=1 Tax=Micromonospora sp. WMMD1102 TaxID=3016105 RepID=UPI0024153C04|nr:hypothetical protein [Micromonospora sp. WMMD1102]MDG4787420.1 hypothetical protein [Micromonospora sp. WMMD1102]
MPRSEGRSAALRPGRAPVVPVAVGDLPEVVEGVPMAVGDLPEVVEGVPVAVGDLPEVVEVVPVAVGGVPEVVEVVPVAVSGVPEVSRVLPEVVGSVPKVLGGTARTLGGLPGLVGAVPEVVGAVPGVVAEVPYHSFRGTPAPRVVPDQPAGWAPSPGLPPPPVPLPVPTQQHPPVPVAAQPLWTPSPLWQSFGPASGGMPDPNRPAVRRAVLGTATPGLPSTPDSPVETGARGQQAGSAQSGGGQSAALPATIGWQSPPRSLSTLPHADTGPTGRSPGVPALPG